MIIVNARCFVCFHFFVGWRALESNSLFSYVTNCSLVLSPTLVDLYVALLLLNLHNIRLLAIYFQNPHFFLTSWQHIISFLFQRCWPFDFI